MYKVRARTWIFFLNLNFYKKKKRFTAINIVLNSVHVSTARSFDAISFFFSIHLNERSPRRTIRIFFAEKKNWHFYFSADYYSANYCTLVSLPNQIFNIFLCTFNNTFVIFSRKYFFFVNNILEFFFLTA